MNNTTDWVKKGFEILGSNPIGNPKLDFHTTILCKCKNYICSSHKNCPVCGYENKK